MAVPLLACGFECGRANAHGASRGPALTGAAAFATAIKRSGDRSLRVNPAVATGVQSGAFTLLAANNDNVGRIYIYFATVPTLTCQVAYYAYSSSVGAYYNATDGKIYAGTSTIALGATGVSVSASTWYRLDIKIDAGQNPWTVDVSVDGSACGQATLAAAAATASVFHAGMNPAIAITADMYYDDVLLSQTLADAPLGAGYVNHFVPTADGTHNVASANDFERGTTGVDITNATTDAYLLLDEVPLDDATPDTDDYINAIAPPNATDYVEVVFGPAPNISTPEAGPRGAEVIVAYHEATTAVGNTRLALNDNGTLDDVYNVSAAGVVTIRYSAKHYADPPSAASAWTAVAGNGNFNNARMRFYSSDAAPDQYWDGAMIEAEFSGVAPSGYPFYVVDSYTMPAFLGLQIG